MKALLTLAVALLFGLSTAASAAGEPAQKKVRKTVTIEKSSEGAWLGVALGTSSLASSDEEKSSAVQGAVIEDVIDESPADSAGLKENDVIIELNGKAVKTADDVVSRVEAMKPGEKASIVVMRDDAKKTFTVKLGARPTMRERSGIHMNLPQLRMNMPGTPPSPPMMALEHRAGVEGMQLMELRDQLGKYFEAPDGKALLVTEVKKNSNARKAGIEAGDVITKIGSTDIEDMGDLHQALKNAKEDTTVDVEIIRKGAHKTVKLAISAREDRMMMNFGNGFPGSMDFHLDHLNFDHQQLREMMKNLKPELEKIKKEIRIKMRGDGRHAPVEVEVEETPEAGTEL